MADKPKTYGQFDQGEGQEYARKTGKAKKVDAGRGSATRPTSSRQDVKTEDQVRSDMRQHRRDVAQGIVKAVRDAI